MGSLRIVAGRLRGRKFAVPGMAGLRPTGARVREALFNILGQDLTGRAVLELYAGSGALGFEAVSRGAVRVVMIEADARTAQGIRRSAAGLGVGSQVGVVAGRVEVLLDRERLGGPFDVIFADPPYGSVDPAGLAELVDRATLLALDGVLVVEHGARDPVGTPNGPLRQVRSERYGTTRLGFFKYI